jgi:hypothetical protein
MSNSSDDNATVYIIAAIVVGVILMRGCDEVVFRANGGKRWSDVPQHLRDRYEPAREYPRPDPFE